MAAPSRLSVLFATAAGPRRGYGHLVRCGVLAHALEARRHVLLHGVPEAASAARRLGWTMHHGLSATLRRLHPDLLVVDDPSAARAARAVRAARRAGIPAASVHDLGLGRVDSDLAIDGSLLVRRRVHAARTELAGPEFAILHPAVAAARGARLERARGLVLIALGGGAHVVTQGVRVAARIAALRPGTQIELAAGFNTRHRRVPLPPGCRWLSAPGGLAAALARASVAVVGGGVTLYEAVALGTPAVALSVVAAQKPTVRAFAERGLAVGVNTRGRGGAFAAADAAVRLVADASGARARVRRGQQVIDGGGAVRVAAALRSLAASKGQVRNAA